MGRGLQRRTGTLLLIRQNYLKLMVQLCVQCGSDACI